MKLLRDSLSVNTSDIKIAALFWVYSVQHYHFNDVFIAIKKKRKHCLVQQLGVREDELGILRCYGHFLNAEIIETAKYPKLLP